MRKSRTIKANRCYHIVSRIAHRAFFMDDEEKNRFIDLLFRAAFFSCVDLIGFCVMSNHIHIYIHLPNDRELTEDEIHDRIYERDFGVYRLQSRRSGNLQLADGVPMV